MNILKWIFSAVAAAAVVGVGLAITAAVATVAAVVSTVAIVGGGLAVIAVAIRTSIR